MTETTRAFSPGNEKPLSRGSTQPPHISTWPPYIIYGYMTFASGGHRGKPV